MTRANHGGVVLAALLTAGCHGIQANPVAPGPVTLRDPVYVVTLTADASTIQMPGSTILHTQVTGAPDGTRVVFSTSGGFIEQTEPGSMVTVGEAATARYRTSAIAGAVTMTAWVNSASKAEPLVLTVLEPPPLSPTYEPPPPQPPPPPDPPPSPQQPVIGVSLVASPTTGTTATVFSFTATAASYYGAAPVTSYAWTFGDGSSATTAGNSTTHTYATTGTKTIRVVASNGTQSASDTEDVTVTAIALSVNVAVTPTVITNGLPVVFRATVTSSAPVPVSLQFEWDAEGDGTYEVTQTGSSPNDFATSYSSTGNRTARVRVTDPISGAQGSGSKPITVGP